MKKVVLCILDGLGYRSESLGNAFLDANTFAIDKLIKEFPNSKLACYDNFSHLNACDSESGHMAIGTGRVILNEFDILNGSISDGSFYDNSNVLEVVNFVNDNKSRLHLFGILSDVSLSYFFLLIDMVSNFDIPIYLHLFLEGEGVSPSDTINNLEQLSSYIDGKNCYIATISGKNYIMNDDNDFDKTKSCYDVIFKGIGPFNSAYKSIINTSYELEIFESYIVPTLVNRNGIFSDGDGIIIANFISNCFEHLFSLVTDTLYPYLDFNVYSNIKCVSLFPISDKVKCKSAFSSFYINNTLIDILSANKLRVLRIAETSKYSCVTRFFDGNRDVTYGNVSSICIPKKRIDSYDMDPSMSAYEITDRVINLMNDYDLIVVNYANCDMVGHTGNYDACKDAIEVVDKCVMNLYEACFNNDYLLIICSSHGNIEEMSRNGKAYIGNTLNPVYFIVCDKDYKVRNGNLCDIAPSIISILGLVIPDEMTGNIIVY